jgi:hypothetical protein
MTVKTKGNSVDSILKTLRENKLSAMDASNDEMSKSHLRYLIGGRCIVTYIFIVG